MVWIKISRHMRFVLGEIKYDIMKPLAELVCISRCQENSVL